jgi:hypothetical protein
MHEWGTCPRCKEPESFCLIHRVCIRYSCGYKGN